MSHTYLGYFKNKDDTYFEFYPCYEYIGDEFVYIQDKIEERYSYSNICVFYNKKPYYVDDKILENNEYCIIEFLDNDIIDYRSDTGSSKSKCYIEDLYEDGKIHPLEDYKVYPIVTAEKTEIDFASNEPIVLNEIFPINLGMKKVLLFYKNEFYGPFEAKYREYDNKNFVITSIKKRNYVLDKINEDNIDESVDPVLIIKNNKNVEFYHMSNQIQIEEIDAMSDEILIEHIANFGNKTSSLIFKDLPKEILTDRKYRAKQIVKSIDVSNELSNLVTDRILKILSAPDSDENKKKILKDIVENPLLISQIQSAKIIKEKLANLEKELEIKKKERDELELQNNKTKNENELLQAQDLILKNDEFKKLSEDIIEKQIELEKICEKLSLAEEVAELEDKLREIKFQYRGYERDKDKVEETIKAKIEAAQKTFQTEIERNLNKSLLTKIDSALKDQKELEEKENYVKVAEKINKATFNEKKGKELVNYIVQEVQKYRPEYDYNFIVNICISIVQNFMMFFIGPPGTGKTSICEILASVFGISDLFSNHGIDEFGVYCNSFIEIPVERGWTSKRDFIGYYNPLSKTLEKANSNIVDFFSLSGNKKTQNLPYIILLDEANLSPLEYYWSDFVGLTDNLTKERFFNLGANYTFKISPNVRFLATMNSDHTVEKLSPRIIDRTPFIILPQPSDFSFSDKEIEKAYLPIDWNEFCNAFSIPINVSFTSYEENIFSELKSLLLKNLNLSLAPRTEKSVRNFCVVAKEFFESQNDIRGEIIAIDYAVLQRILPKISGSGEDYGKGLNELLNFFEKYNLLKSQKVVRKILKKGNKNFNNYDFFAIQGDTLC